MNTHDIEPMKYGTGKNDDYVTGWNDCWAAIEADRKRRGEPSGYAYRYRHYDGGTVIRFNDGCEVNGSRPIEALPYWFTPQPADPRGAQKLHNEDSGAQNGIQAPQPAEPDLAKCAECGAELILVRPGKWQHPDCPQSPWATSPPALGAADLAFIADELRQAGKNRAADMVMQAMRRRGGC